MILISQALKCLISEVNEATAAKTHVNLSEELIDVLAALVLTMIIHEQNHPGCLARAAFSFGSKATQRGWSIDLLLWTQRAIIASAVKQVAGALRSNPRLGADAANVFSKCIANHQGLI